MDKQQVALLYKEGEVDMSTRKKMDYIVSVLNAHGVHCKVYDHLFFFTLETTYNGRFLAFEVARKDIHKLEVSHLTEQALSIYRVIHGM